MDSTVASPALPTARYSTCLTDFLPPSDRQVSLANQNQCTNMPSWTANKINGRVGFKTNREALGGYADRIMCLNSRDVVYFAILSGRSYLCPGDMSVSAFPSAFRSTCLPVLFIHKVTHVMNGESDLYL